jgi:hypothetical protein
MPFILTPETCSSPPPPYDIPPTVPIIHNSPFTIHHFPLQPLFRLLAPESRLLHKPPSIVAYLSRLSRDMESVSAAQRRPAHPSPTPPPASRGHRSLITQYRADLAQPAPTRPDLSRCPLGDTRHCKSPASLLLRLILYRRPVRLSSPRRGEGEGEVLVGDPPRRDGKASLGTLN